ncbi:MAG: glutathione S-transferase N-terminal domain-containing protein [Parahaliea sp.]
MANNLIGSMVTSSLRGANGVRTEPAAVQPALILRLYNIENCPYCRLVREVLTELNIDVEIYPCPKGGERFRSTVVELAGKEQFPYLYDPNTGEGLYESLDIIAYLYRHYAGRPLPRRWRMGSLQTIGSTLASTLGRGSQQARGAGREPEQLLELYSFEGSPFSRLVRQALCQQELPYVVRQCGRTTGADWLPPALRERLGIQGSSRLPNRRYLMEHTGRIAVPYLYDPNTGEGLYESGDIIRYLRQHYGR